MTYREVLKYPYQVEYTQLLTQIMTAKMKIEMVLRFLVIDKNMPSKLPGHNQRKFTLTKNKQYY